MGKVTADGRKADPTSVRLGCWKSYRGPRVLPWAPSIWMALGIYVRNMKDNEQILPVVQNYS